MANRQFTVSARITADTRDAERNTRALAKAEEELGKRLTDLQAKFDAGTISGEKFLRGQAAIERQAGRLRASIEDAGRGGDAAQSSLSRFAEFLRGRLVATLGDVQSAARAAFGAIQESGRLAGQENVLRAQIRDLDAYLAKLDEVAQGTVSRAQLIRSASTAILLGIPAERIAELLEVARASAVATGTSVAAAFDDIARGIGRTSPLILDNLGIVVDLNAAYARYAESVGKATGELTKQEQQAALTNAVIDQTRDRVELAADAQDKLATATERASAAAQNIIDTLTRLGVGLVQGVAGGFFAAATAATLLAEAIIKVQKTTAGWLALIPLIGRAWRPVADLFEELDDQIDPLQRKLAGLASDLANGFGAAFGLVDDTTAAVRTLSETVEQSAGPAVTSYARELEKLREESDELAETTDALSAGQAALGDGFRARTRELAEHARQIVQTARAYDALAAAQGRAAATQAALAGGGRLTLAGTRIRLPGGGSRLTRDPGLSTGFPVSTNAGGLG